MTPIDIIALIITVGTLGLSAGWWLGHSQARRDILKDAGGEW